MALAAGAKTYKMRYGNRGMNQPAIDLRTTKCYITRAEPRLRGRHGEPAERRGARSSSTRTTTRMRASSTSSRPSGAQFHPEAAGGPTDTAFLFDTFIERKCAARPPIVTLLSPRCTTRPDQVRKVLLLGSGGLSIGQAGEFDYSGSQAIKALKEEGLEVVLINPNIATVQTSPGDGGPRLLPRPSARPTTCTSCRSDVIRRRRCSSARPDASSSRWAARPRSTSAIELWRDQGMLAGVRGCACSARRSTSIIATEDREIFSQKLARSTSTLAHLRVGDDARSTRPWRRRARSATPCSCARPSRSAGSARASRRTSRSCAARRAGALCSSPQILIDQDLRGWKEVEYEVVRDCRDNCLTVCNMENFDPLGVHTGDSIVVAPSQTLSNREYFMLRSTALKVVRHLGVVGECNIQYALHPETRALLHHRGERAPLALVGARVQGDGLPARVRRGEARARPRPRPRSRTRSPRRRPRASSPPSTTASSRCRAGTSPSSRASRRASARR